MPPLKQYRLFISHSWAYGDAYEKLVKFFNENPNFKWVNYSVPKDNPIHDAPNSIALYNAIKDQVRPVHCVVMMAGKYSTYSEWINKEIEISKQVFTKPIVAVAPWGAQQISKVVQNNSDVIARWNSSSIVNAIRTHSL